MENIERAKFIFGDYIKENLTGELFGFFKGVMPKTDRELVILMSRKAYCAYMTFRKIYGNKFDKRYDKQIIHDKFIAEWDIENGESFDGIDSIRIVDDTLIYGTGVFDLAKRLVDQYHVDSEKITINVFGLNKNIYGKYAENSQEYKQYMKEDDKTCLRTHQGNEKFKINFKEELEINEIKELTSRIISFNHTYSTPYIIYSPTYSFSFHDSKEIIFNGEEMPSPSYLFESLKNLKSYKKIEDITTNREKKVNVYTACVVCAHDKQFEEFACLNLYFNYQEEKVTIIPYVIFNSLSPDYCDEKAGLIYGEQIYEGLVGEPLKEKKKSIRQSIYRMLRYKRAEEVVKKFLPGIVDNNKSEILYDLFNNSIFYGNNNLELRKDFQSTKLKSDIVEYKNIASIKRYFDELSTPSQRDQGESFLYLKKLFRVSMERLCIESMKLLNSGFIVPSVVEDKESGIISYAVRDGEMSTDVYFENLQGMIWAFNHIKNNKDEWSKVNDKKKEIKNKILKVVKKQEKKKAVLNEVGKVIDKVFADSKIIDDVVYDCNDDDITIQYILNDDMVIFFVELAKEHNVEIAGKIVAKYGI